MNTTEHAFPTRLLALTLLSVMTFMAAMGPASASAETGLRAAVAPAESRYGGIGAEGALVTQARAHASDGNREINYLVTCTEGHGYVSTWIEGTNANGYATFDCTGTYSYAGVIH